MKHSAYVWTQVNWWWIRKPSDFRFAFPNYLEILGQIRVSDSTDDWIVSSLIGSPPLLCTEEFQSVLSTDEESPQSRMCSKEGNGFSLSVKWTTHNAFSPSLIANLLARKKWGKLKKAMVQKEFLPLLKDEYFTHHCFTPCMVFRSFFGEGSITKETTSKGWWQKGKRYFFLHQRTFRKPLSRKIWGIPCQDGLLMEH